MFEYETGENRLRVKSTSPSIQAVHQNVVILETVWAMAMQPFKRNVALKLCESEIQVLIKPCNLPQTGLNRGSDMSAHVLLNLSNELGKTR